MNSKNQNQGRREFLKKSAFLGSLIALNPFKLVSKPFKVEGYPAVRERIVPVAILDDTAGLIVRDYNFSHVIIESFQEEMNLMYCGKTFERGKEYLPELLNTIKKADWGDESRYQKAAVICGWLIYREIPPVIAPLYKNESSQKGSLLRDTAILKYKAEVEPSDDTAEMADILKLIWHRVACRIHTLTPDVKEWNSWILDYIDWYLKDRKDMQEFAELLQKEHSAEWNEYIKRTNFFAPHDKLIKVANDFSKREISLDSDLLAVKGQSLYAQAIAKGIRAIKEFDNYLNGDISDKKMMKRLDI